MNADDVRRAFLDYEFELGHVRLARAPLVPRDDPTTLFTGSGMQPLLPYLLGAPNPSGPRLTDSQPCLRAQDIDEVGDDRHTTFFEMLGNWSLGEYFKQEQLPAVWAFLTERIGLDPARIYVTCFAGDPEFDIPKDTESAEIWGGLFEQAGLDHAQVELFTAERGGELGSHGARITFYGDKNWWCRGGTAATMRVGDPGGPDSEVFYLYPQIAHDVAFGDYCHPNCECGRYVEIGNSVFMQYRRTVAGFELLPRRNVDFGGGLERIAAAAIDSPDVYRISLLWPIIERLERLTGVTYDDRARELRIIADHLRGATFLAVDGVVPSNKEQGYVMRRLIRRAVRVAFELGLGENFLAELVPAIADLYHDSYPEVADRREIVIAVLVREEQRFRRTLSTGLRHLRTFTDRPIGGAELFLLYDTYGFPVELSTEEAQTAGMALVPDWRDQFDARMAEQRARSQAAARPA